MEKEKLLKELSSSSLKSPDDTLMGPVVVFNQYLHVETEEQETTAENVAAKIMELQDEHIRKNVRSHGENRVSMMICTAPCPNSMVKEKDFEMMFLAPKGSPAEAYARMSEEAHKTGVWTDKDANEAVKKCNLTIAPVTFVVPKWMKMADRIEKLLREFKM